MKTVLNSSGWFRWNSAAAKGGCSVMVRCLLLVVAVSTAVTLAGCSFTVHEPPGAGVRRSTVGQELLDLKRAYDSGAITESEYARKKEELLETSR